MGKPEITNEEKAMAADKQGSSALEFVLEELRDEVGRLRRNL